VIRIGTIVFKRYSEKALHAMHDALRAVDMDKVWALHKPSGRRARR